MKAEVERPMAIRGKLSGLRPPWPEDFPDMFSWWTDKREAPLWTSAFRQITTFQDFVPQVEGWLRGSITLMKIDLSNGVRFGFVRAYNLNLVDGYVWTQRYIVPSYRMRRHAAEATFLFTRYLFEQLPIRKICSEVFEFNERARQLNEKIGFRFEGRLREHTWYKDRYWDHLFYSISREAWLEAMERYALIAGVEEDLAERAEIALTEGRAT